MRVAYCTNVRLPSERAHGYQIASVANAMVELGHSVEIFAPWRASAAHGNFSEFYKVSPDINLTHIGNRDFIDCNWTPGVLGLWTMNFMLRKKLPGMLQGFDLLYTRTPALLSALLTTGIPTIIELHKLPIRNQKGFAMQCNKCAAVVCLTSPMREGLVSMGVAENLVTVEGDAVDIAEFGSLPDRESARGKFGIGKGEFAVGYAGSIKTMSIDKGVGQIVDAVRCLRSQGSSAGAIIAGGPPDAAEELKRRAGDGVHIVGQFRRCDVKKTYAACDALIYPAPKTDNPYFTRDTSPMKIFEYMASGKPVICADIPPVRDILDESVAVFYAPGDVPDLVKKMEFVRDHKTEVDGMVERSKERVKKYTWPNRMDRILERANSIS